MGKSRNYLPGGGFKEITYRTIEVLSDGIITGKIIESMFIVDNPSLPLHSNMSKIYFIRDPRQNNRVTQMRMYVDRKAAFDFDWGHQHKSFPKGTVHVHEWYTDKKGRWLGRSKGKHDARAMTFSESKQTCFLYALRHKNFKLRNLSNNKLTT